MCEKLRLHNRREKHTLVHSELSLLDSVQEVGHNLAVIVKETVKNETMKMPFLQIKQI